MRQVKVRVAIAAALVLVFGGALALDSGASDPPAQTLTVPGAAGSSSVSWTGTITPANVHPTSDCNSPGTGPPDEELLKIQVPSTGYSGITATFTFQITWTPSSPDPSTSDEILTVNGPDNGDPGDTKTTEVGSSDGSSTTETVVAHNLAPGTYHVLACGFNNLLAQDYRGTATVDVAAQTDDSLPSADARGLEFGAAVPADAQRDQAEPLIEIDRAGNIYTCGPTGFSNAAEYTQVSTDGGDQFHLLGTPPRGQIGFGGGGDCALATGVDPNAQGNYTWAYSGLGALTGFTTSTSPDNGHSIGNSGPNGNGLPAATTSGALADRQWMTFLDDHRVLLSYNQQEPRNVVVQQSDDGGLTYSPVSHIAAPNPEFPGPMHYIKSSNIVYFPWTKGEEVNLAISRDQGVTWTECKVATGSTVKGGTAGFATADNDKAGNVYVAWADSDRYHTWLSTLTADKLTGCNESIAAVRSEKDATGKKTGQPSVDPGWSEPLRMDRDAVHTTVFPWVAAQGAPGRVAVAYYGTTSDGDPNTGKFKAAWDVYASQSLDALAGAGASVGQVKVTTNPFHYDSICLNGLACDLAVPPGDRSLADFFAIAFNPVTGRLSVVFDRTNKQPDEALGHVATPMVATQIAGPSNGGGTVVTGRHVVDSSVVDPSGDALSNYSLTAAGPPPPPPPTKNEPAADVRGVAIGPDAATGGFTVTLRVADLSPAALSQALADTGGQSLLWVFRFGDGYLDADAVASWSPATGFTYGFDRYATGGSPCESTRSGDKCQVYPGGTPIAGSADQATGQITLTVPASSAGTQLLYALGGDDGHGRPAQSPASVGTRFYSGTALTLANTTSPSQAQQTFLYPLDETAAFDFLLPAATPVPAGGGQSNGGTSSGGSPSGGSPSPNGGSPSPNGGSPNGGTTTGTTPTPTPTAPGPAGGAKGVNKSVTHMVLLRGTVRASVRTTTARAWINRRSVLYADRLTHLRFKSTRVTSVAIRGHSATLRGLGIRNGVKGVHFRVVLVAGKTRTVHVWFGRYVRSGRVVRGTLVVR